MSSIGQTMLGYGCSHDNNKSALPRHFSVLPSNLSFMQIVFVLGRKMIALSSADSDRSFSRCVKKSKQQLKGNRNIDCTPVNEKVL